MCKHCNRSKSDDTMSTVPDLAQSVIVNMARGNQIDNVTKTSVLATNAYNEIGGALGLKKKRNHTNSSYRTG